MAEMLTVHVDGLAELQRRMLALPDRLEKNVVRRALWAGAAEIRTEARNKAPVWTGEVSAGHPPPGTLKRSIVAVNAPEKSAPGHTVTLVTVRHGKKFRKQGKTGSLSQDAFYWWWVEFGTAKMTPRPFMRPAFEAAKFHAKDAIAAKLDEGITQETANLR